MSRKKAFVRPIDWKQCDCGCLGDTFMDLWRRVHTEDGKVLAVDLRMDLDEHGAGPLIKRFLVKEEADEHVREIMASLVKKLQEYLP